MAKPNLRQALSRQPASAPSVAAPIAPDTHTQPRSLNYRPDRAGKKFVGGWYDKAVHKQLNIMSAEMERDIDDLVGEALNDFFAKHRKPELVILKAQKPTS
jgi:hypothetical protein